MDTRVRTADWIDRDEVGDSEGSRFLGSESGNTEEGVLIFNRNPASGLPCQKLRGHKVCKGQFRKLQKRHCRVERIEHFHPGAQWRVFETSGCEEQKSNNHLDSPSVSFNHHQLNNLMSQSPSVLPFEP